VGHDSSRITGSDRALVGLVGISTVAVTLEIEAQIPTGAHDTVVQTVTENNRMPKFTHHGFEKK